MLFAFIIIAYHHCQPYIFFLKTQFTARLHLNKRPKVVENGKTISVRLHPTGWGEAVHLLNF